MMPDGKELVLETLLDFRHFESAPDSAYRDNLGVPPPLDANKAGAASRGGRDGRDLADDSVDYDDHNPVMHRMRGERRDSMDTAISESGMNRRAQKSLTYSQVRWIGEYSFVVSLCGVYFLFPSFFRLGISLIVLFTILRFSS